MTDGLDRRLLLRGGAGQAAQGAAAGGQRLTTGTAHAAGEFDFIKDCATWGARQPGGSISTSTGTTRKILVHHMAFPNSDDDTWGHAKQLAKDQQNLHMDTNGWSDTGNHFTVSRGGWVLEGRHGSLSALQAGTRQTVGAHCPGENDRSIGIENEGTYIDVPPPTQLLTSLAGLCTLICKQYRLKAHNVFGHWDFRETQCPGITFYRLFPMVRRMIAGGLGTAVADVPLRTWPDIHS